MEQEKNAYGGHKLERNMNKKGKNYQKILQGRIINSIGEDGGRKWQKEKEKF